MYDVFRFLTGSPASSIHGRRRSIPATLPYRRNDNFSATIGYEDGSLAHLLYTSLGPKTGLARSGSRCSATARPTSSTISSS